MGDKPTLLPSSDYVPDPDTPNVSRCIVTFRLSQRMGEVEEVDLKKGIEWFVRVANADLVVIDITDGEPMWLHRVLHSFDSYGLPAHIVGAPSQETIKALKAARARGAEFVAERLGFPPLQVANGTPVGLTVVNGDVRFDLEVDGDWHTFRISREALEDLEGVTGDFDRLATFERHQQRIVDVARRMVNAGVRAPEILIRTEFFG